jgi:hypothetical protein
VSNLGRVVRKWKGGSCYEVGYDVDAKGYTRVSMDDKRYSVHRLVAKLFIPNPNDYQIVHHKDTDPTNNAVSNLEWCTQQYNVECSLSKHYLIKSPDGEVHDVFNLKKFCREHDLNNAHMVQVMKGKLPSYKGWKGRYIEQ